MDWPSLPSRKDDYPFHKKDQPLGICPLAWNMIQAFHSFGFIGSSNNPLDTNEKGEKLI